MQNSSKVNYYYCIDSLPNCYFFNELRLEILKSVKFNKEKNFTELR